MEDLILLLFTDNEVVISMFDSLVIISCWLKLSDCSTGVEIEINKDNKIELSIIFLVVIASLIINIKQVLDQNNMYWFLNKLID